METQDGQIHESWVTENHLDPKCDGIYQNNLIPGARFLYFALHELGLVSEPIPRYKLEAAVHEVSLKHGLVAGDWEMLERCIDLGREVEFIIYQNEIKATQEGSDFDPIF